MSAIQMGRPSKFRGHTNVFDINMPFNKLPRQDGDTRGELPVASSTPSSTAGTPHNGGNLPYHLQVGHRRYTSIIHLPFSEYVCNLNPQLKNFFSQMFIRLNRTYYNNN